MAKEVSATETRPTLLQRVGALDPASWREFVTLYDPLLLAYVGDCSRRYNLGLREHDREDVKQEVLIKLYRALPTFALDRSGKGRFRTWLWRVVHNATIDWVRSRPRGERGGEDQPGADGPSGAAAGGKPQKAGEVCATPDQLAQAAEDVPPPDEQLIQEHLWQVRRHILDRVRTEMQSSQKWACFEKHVLQDRRSADVAAELGLTVSAVNTYTSRVLARIRELCAEYEAEL
jgi:RNA polymerase sigma factor (sigma-70 family)